MSDEKRSYKQKDKAIYEAVGKTIAELRAAQGKKISQVACEGLSATIVSKMEKGEALTLDNLKRVSDQLGVSVARLFQDADGPSDVPSSPEPDATACEGCGEPSDGQDEDGTPLCNACAEPAACELDSQDDGN